MVFRSTVVKLLLLKNYTDQEKVALNQQALGQMMFLDYYDVNTFEKDKKLNYFSSTASLPRSCQEARIFFSQKYPLTTISDPINSQSSRQRQHNTINPISLPEKLLLQITAIHYYYGCHFYCSKPESKDRI